MNSPVCRKKIITKLIITRLVPFFSKLFVYFVDLDVSVVDEFERREWTESASC